MSGIDQGQDERDKTGRMEFLMRHLTKMYLNDQFIISWFPFGRDLEALITNQRKAFQPKRLFEEMFTTADVTGIE